MIYMVTPNCSWDSENKMMFRNGEKIFLPKEHTSILDLLFKNNGQFVSLERLYFAMTDYEPYGANWTRKVNNAISRKTEHEKGILYWIPELADRIESSRLWGKKIFVPSKMIISKKREEQISEIRERMFFYDNRLIPSTSFDKDICCIGREKIIEMIENKFENNKLIYISGSLGTGKSNLAKYICQKRSTGIAYLELSQYGNLTIKSVICSIIYYLSIYNDSYCSEVCKCLKEKDFSFLSHVDASELLVYLCINTFNRISSSESEQIIVLDGVDSIAGWEEFIRLIEDNSLLFPSGLKFLIILDNDNYNIHFLTQQNRINILEEQNEEAIIEYLTYRLNMSKIKYSDELIPSLVEKSGGSFLYCSLMLEDIISFKHIPDSFYLPVGINDIYLKIFNRLCSEDDGSFELYRKGISVLLLINGFIKKKIFFDILQLKGDENDLFVKKIGKFLIINSDEIGFRHWTMAEWFKNDFRFRNAEEEGANLLVNHIYRNFGKKPEVEQFVPQLNSYLFFVTDESLLNEIQKDKQFLIYQINVYRRYSKYEEAILLAEKAIRFQSEYDDNRFQTELARFRAWNEKDYKKRKSELLAIQNEFKQYLLKDYYSYVLYYEILAEFYQTNLEPAESLNSIELAIKQYEKINSWDEESEDRFARTLVLKAWILMINKQYDECFDILNKAINSFESGYKKTKNLDWAFAYMHRGRAYIYCKMYPQAKEDFERALSMFNENGYFNSRYTANLYLEMSRLELKNGSMEKAEEYVDKSTQINELLYGNNDYHIFLNYFFKAFFLFEKADYLSSVKIIEKAIEVGKGEEPFYKFIGNLYEMKGDCLKKLNCDEEEIAKAYLKSEDYKQIAEQFQLKLENPEKISV